MGKFTSALGAMTSKLRPIEIHGVTAYVISEPIEIVETQALFRSVGVMPKAMPDDLPYDATGDDADAVKGIAKIAGKITTQRQYQAALMGLQTQKMWRALLSLVDESGKYIADNDQDAIEMLQLMRLDGSIVGQIEIAVGWDAWDADKLAKAEKAAKDSADAPKIEVVGKEQGPNE